MDDIILKRIIKENNVVKYDYEVTGKLKDFFTTGQLFIEYEVDISSVPDSILVIPFVNIMIGITWVTHSVLWVKEIDKSFYDSLKDVKVGYQELYPHYKMGGRLVAYYKIDNKINCAQENSAILLFSGGIDAHTSYIKNKEKHLLLFNVQGDIPRPKEESKAQLADYKDIREFASRNLTGVTFVKSNFRNIVDNNVFHKRIEKRLKDSWWHGIVHSMAFISMAIPIAYLFRIPEIIIASSFTTGDKSVCGSYPTVDSEYKFANYGYVIHDGFEMSRQEKVAFIVNYQKKSGKPYPIRVCSFNDHNCCVCAKCFRTIVEIISEGGDIHNFAFDKVPADIKSFYKDYLKENFQFFGSTLEFKLYYPLARERAKINYDKIEGKEFMDWFETFDFVNERKKAVLRYRLKNFFKLFYKKIVRK